MGRGGGAKGKMAKYTSKSEIPMLGSHLCFEYSVSAASSPMMTTQERQRVPQSTHKQSLSHKKEGKCLKTPTNMVETS